MSTPVVYIALLLHCIGKNANLLICFWKVPLKGGAVGAFEIFCCLARIGISLTTEDEFVQPECKNQLKASMSSLNLTTLKTQDPKSIKLEHLEVTPSFSRKNIQN